MNLVPYIKAQYSILYLVTPEESRAEAAINETAKELKRNLIEGVPKVFASRWCETDFADLGRLSAGSGSVRIHA
jgi:hypothetical protein